MHLDDEAVRVLQLAGVRDEFAAISRPGAGLRLLDARMRPFATFHRASGPAAHGHAASNLFDQPDLDALLRDRSRAGRRDPAGGLDVTGVAAGADGRSPSPHRDMATGRQQTLLAAAVLGCDGADSTVRATIGVGLRDLGFTAAMAGPRHPLPVDQRWVGRCGPGLRSAPGRDPFMRLTGDRYRWEFR